MASVDEPGFLVVVLEATLACTFMIAIESSLILSLPLRFLHGGDIVGWSKWGWGLTFGVTAFVFVHVLIRGGTGYIAEDQASFVTALILGVTFAAISFGFWAYFRFRPARALAC